MRFFWQSKPTRKVDVGQTVVTVVFSDDQPDYTVKFLGSYFSSGRAFGLEIVHSHERAMSFINDRDPIGVGNGVFIPRSRVSGYRQVSGPYLIEVDD